jgi:hypothetical protein
MVEVATGDALAISVCIIAIFALLVCEILPNCCFLRRELEYDYVDMV